MSIEVISHVRQVENATENAMKRAARMIGGSVAGHAIERCPVDTGLLRNSITFALGGEAPQKQVYYDDSKEQSGEYDGVATKDEDNEITVYIGTNVQYAPYQELGAPNIHLNARPFLRPAMEENVREIEQIIKQTLGSLK